MVTGFFALAHSATTLPIDHMTWSRMTKLADAWLQSPRILHPWPEQRFAVTHPFATDSVLPKAKILIATKPPMLDRHSFKIGTYLPYGGGAWELGSRFLMAERLRQ